MLRPEPYCPGCERLARPKDLGNGTVGWSCGSKDCPCAAFLDSWNPNPTPPLRREAGLFDRRNK